MRVSSPVYFEICHAMLYLTDASLILLPGLTNEQKAFFEHSQSELIYSCAGDTWTIQVSGHILLWPKQIQVTESKTTHKA